MASNRLHREAVNGRTTPVGPERARGWSDPDTVLELVDKADNFVDSMEAEQWIDCFQLNGDTYEVNVCDCKNIKLVYAHGSMQTGNFLQRGKLLAK